MQLKLTNTLKESLEDRIVKNADRKLKIIKRFIAIYNIYTTHTQKKKSAIF